MSKTLEQLYNEHQGKVSDKWTLYLHEYQRLFEPYKDDRIRLLEIGIQNGGSLELWGKYFPSAEKIIGCDINPKCSQLQYGDARIKVIVGDANAEDCQTRILQEAPSFDIILDDGSHKSSDIIRSFLRYFPYVKDYGVYAVEDLHCSYWQGFEGGLYDPYSAIAFFKRLADVINHEHWRNNRPRTSLITKFAEEFGLELSESDLTTIHSIEFINSMCILRKSSPDKNVLGRRVVVGSDESVAIGMKKLNGTEIGDALSNIKDEPNLDVFELISQVRSIQGQIQSLQQELDQSNDLLVRSERQLQDLNLKLLEIYGSRAWKLTQTMWKARLFLAPPGSRREQALKRFIK